jgi:hypothetical protein
MKSPVPETHTLYLYTVPYSVHFNPLKPSGNCYIPPALATSKSAFFIYVFFFMIFSVKRNYFLKQC